MTHTIKFLSHMWILAIVGLLSGCGSNGGVGGGSGFIEADEVLISAETAGRVVVRHANESDEVSVGDTLLVIDPSRLELQLQEQIAAQTAAEAGLKTQRLQLKQAERNVEYATTERNRIEQLAKTSSATRQQLDKITYEYDQAVVAAQTASAAIESTEAELVRLEVGIAQVKRQLQDCYPLSPLNGTVIEKMVEPGELVSPGKALFKLARIDTVWVKVYVPTAMLVDIKVGQELTVSTESGNSEYTGIVTWTSDEAEFTPKNVQTEQSRADLVYAVKVRIANPNRELKIGMPVFVQIG